MEIKSKKIKKLKNINNELNYIICEYDMKIRLIYSFIKRNLNKNIIVFFSTDKTVEFINEIFNSLNLNLEDKNINLSKYKDIKKNEYDWILFYDYFNIDNILKYKNNLIFLTKKESLIVKNIENSKKLDFSKSKMYDINCKINKIIKNNYFLNKLSRDSFKSYIKYYFPYFNNFDKMDMRDICKGFGLDYVPRVNL